MSLSLSLSKTDDLNLDQIDSLLWNSGEVGKRRNSSTSTLKPCSTYPLLPIVVSTDLIVYSIICLLLTGGRR